jgi:hypothetical protein
MDAENPRRRDSRDKRVGFMSKIEEGSPGG